jgi:hypothetical protein
VLKGASVISVQTFFGDLIYQGTEKSQLRIWELNMQRLDVTDCVELELSDLVSTYGRIKVRIGREVGYQITNQLHA